MNTKPLFTNEAQAITVTFHMVQNLGVMVGWAVLWGLHLVLAFGVALAMWWLQVTPELVRASVLAMLGSTHAALAGAAGVSALGVATIYVALIRWVWMKTFVPWQIAYLMRGVQTE